MGKAHSQSDRDHSINPCIGLPHRTKVVRLIVVHDENPEAVQELAAREGAAKPDVFIVGTEAKSFLNGVLVDHDTAIRSDAETVAFVIVKEREQLQWESDVNFEIVEFVKVNDTITRVHCIPPKDDDLKWAPNDDVNVPAEPFPDLRGVERRERRRGGPGKPVRSGLADPYFQGQVKGQLYRMTFDIWAEGDKEEPRRVDPDVYCDP